MNTTEINRLSIGPRDPLAPTGEVVTIQENSDGSAMQIQEYEDGTLYQVVVPRGAHVRPLDVPGAVWFGVYSPRDDGDLSDDSLYLSFWKAGH